MAIKKSPKNVTVNTKKDGHRTGDVSLSGIPKRNRRSKGTSRTSKTTIRRNRVSQRSKPNTEAANDVVAQSVAVYISTKSDHSKLEETSNKSPKQRGKDTEKRAQTKPQARIKSTTILADDVKKEARSQQTGKRKGSPSAAREPQRLRDTKTTGSKRSSKRGQSLVRKAESQPTDAKTNRSEESKAISFSYEIYKDYSRTTGKFSTSYTTEENHKKAH